MSRKLVLALPKLLTLVVLVMSGAYLLIYLYRWEWNRALIAGLFFVAAEVALTGWLLAARFASLEAQLAEPLPLRPELSSASPPAQPTAPRFAWLVEPQGFGVFIPVLLGAGVAVSALSYLVERAAALFGGPAADRRSRELLGLTGPAQRIPARHPRAGLARWLAAGLAAVVLTVGGIDLLADATQSRPDPTLRHGVTTLVVHIEQRRSDRTLAQAAEALWIACRSTTPADYQLASVANVAAGRITLEIRPELGRHTRRRLVGCLEDATLELIRADVEEVTDQSTA